MEVKLPALEEIMTDQPTVQASNQRTDKGVYWEVTLSKVRQLIMKVQFIFKYLTEMHMYTLGRVTWWNVESRERERERERVKEREKDI